MRLVRRCLRRLSNSCLPAFGDSCCTSPAVTSCRANPSRSSSVSRSGGKSLLEFFADVVERVVPLSRSKTKYSWCVEPVVLQADRVLDDVAESALVALIGDDEVGADAQLDLLAPLGSGNEGRIHTRFRLAAGEAKR